jgi:hypothetical protein
VSVLVSPCMFTLMTLFGLMVAGFVCLAVFIAALTVFKLAIHAIFWPLKLLLLPFILVAVVIKVALLVTVAAVVVAVLIPIGILVLLFAAPFMLLSALT